MYVQNLEIFLRESSNQINLNVPTKLFQSLEDFHQKNN